MHLAKLIQQLDSLHIGQHTISCGIVPIGRELDDCVSFYLFPGTLHRTPAGMYAIGWIPSTKTLSPINISYFNKTVCFGTMFAVKPVKVFCEKNSKAVAIVEEFGWMHGLVLQEAIQHILTHKMRGIDSLQNYLKDVIAKVQEGKVLIPVAKSFLQMLLDRLVSDDRTFTHLAKILNSFLDFQYKTLKPTMFGGNPAHTLIVDYKKTLVIQNKKFKDIGEIDPEQLEKQQADAREMLEKQNTSIEKAREGLFAKTALLFLMTTEKDFASLEEILAVGKERLPNTALIIEDFDACLRKGLQRAVDEEQVVFDDLLQTYSLTKQGWSLTTELMNRENKNEQPLKE